MKARPLARLMGLVAIGALIAGGRPRYLPGQVSWQVATRPRIDVMGQAASGELVFETPVFAMLASNGNLLVADKGSTSIRVVDGKGRLVRNVGRRGDGPGEFGYIGWGVACGVDSMLVGQPSMFSMIAKDGRVVRRFRVPADSGPASLKGVGCLADGSIVYQTAMMDWDQQRIPDMFVTRVGFAATTRLGAFLWKVDSLPGGEWVGTHPGGYPRPLGTNYSAVVTGASVMVGVSDRQAFTALPSRRLIALELAGKPGSPSDEELESAIQQVADIAPPDFRSRVEAALRRFPKPDKRPLFYGAVGDPTGCVWVQLSAPGEPQTTYAIVAASSGAPVAQVRVPLALRIFQVGADYIVGLTFDQNDEPHIVVLDLTRRPVRP